MAKRANPWDYPQTTRNLEGTIFNQKFLTVIMDEAHHLRNLGAKQLAGLRILDQAVIRLVLTATPLHTGPRVRDSFSHIELG